MKASQIIEDTDAGDTIGFWNILYIVSDTKEFSQWLTDFHKIHNSDPFLEGYKFFVTTSLRAFLNSFIMYDPFRLKDDEISRRAEHVGIKLGKLPNSCEKIIFQKNIWEMGKEIRKAKSWKVLDVKKSLLPLFELYENIQKNNLVTNKNLSITDTIRYLSMFNSYLFLVDTQHGRPKGYYHPFFKTRPSTKYLNKAFAGYAYALEFLWYKMLGKEEFLKSCTKDLHRSEEIGLGQDRSVTETDEEYEFEEESSPEETKEQELHRQVIKKWTSIDQFFTRIQKEIIRPLEEKIGHRSVTFREELVKIHKFEKSNLDNFLDKDNLNHSELMENTSVTSINDLNMRFLWYDIDMFDAVEANLHFNGSFAFIAMLTGYVTQLEESGSDYPIDVMKIIHPQKHGDGNYYSLAIKIGVVGLLSDASGWVVFYDALIDSPGTGGHHRDRCFDCIEKFRKKSQVNLKEITVDKKLFREFLEIRKVSIANEIELSIGYKESSDGLGQMKGKLFECIFQKYCLDSGRYEKVCGDVTLSNQQIDCFCSVDDSIDVFECKMRYHKKCFEEYIKQIKNITQVTEEKYPGKNVTPFFVTYFPMTRDEIEKLECEKIKVIHNFKNWIERGIVVGEKRKILQMLEFELKEKFYKRQDSDWYAY